jgi:crotonobetainyl-CoA:carnitine CoA-transferase CaiB-like acyl-CoA transferase
MPKSNNKHAAGPLEGIRVLDLSRVLAGPWASQLLADYGADVIKIERPGSGDDTREWGPPWLSDPSTEAPIDSAYFLAANRNKRSLTVNLASKEGQTIVRDLAASSDILLENFKVGTLQRFTLDYDSVREINRRLIYCSISAYGQTGSRSHLPGYDAMMQASAGLMSITGASDEDGGSPQKVGVAITDIMAGMYAVTAILAALHAREKNGAGQYIDLALYDSQVAWLANQNMNYLVGGMLPQRQGTAHPNLVPYQVFGTAGGYLMLAVGNDRQFRACVTCLGVAELADDERFVHNRDRLVHRNELVRLLAGQFLQHDVEHWLKTLHAAGVPAGPINNIADIFADPYAAERQLKRTLTHVKAGRIPTVANPVKFSLTPVGYRHAPPELGQHTHEILADELGYSDDKIRSLHASGAI